MKITKSNIKDFFKLIMDEDPESFQKAIKMLRLNPAFSNQIVNGISKGIEGYSALMLAVRYYNFEFAIELVKSGADVNYIDNSPIRNRHYPIFHDLLESLKDTIEVKNYGNLNVGFELWDEMELAGLNYSQLSVSTDGVNKPENCLQAFIKYASTKYKHNHKVHLEPKPDQPNRSDLVYVMNEDSRDIEKELWYDKIAEKLVDRIDIKLVDELDANNHRNSGNFFITTNGNCKIIDCHSLIVANKHVQQRFNKSIKNIDDNSLIDSYKLYAKKLAD